MKSLTSVLGWLLLLAVLIVPSFLFYNWWTANKQKDSSEAAQEQAASNIFPPAEKDRPAAPPAKPVAAQAVLPAQPVAFSTAPQRPGAQPAFNRAAAATVLSTAAAQPPRATPAVSVSTQPKPVSYYGPKGDRDPTLSPMDYSRLKELELQRLETERMRRQAASYKPKEQSFESRLQLQGIVGSAAIINGEMYLAGQTIHGAKILKVGANYVICEYKGRKFKKVLK